ncbi:hypothetical protein IAU59_000954 [Kwoniella sp. CBS 9459]
MVTIPQPLAAGLALLAYPFFILLHLTFIISSVVLRTYQALSAGNPEANSYSDSDKVTETHSTQAEATHTEKYLQRSPPKHIGLVLVPSPRTSKSSIQHDGGQRQRQRRSEVEALKLTVLRVIEWAQERGGGVDEISVWDGQGLTQSAVPELLHTLTSSSNGLPPSPPDSSPSTPHLLPTQDGPVEDSLPSMSDPSLSSPTQEQNGPVISHTSKTRKLGQSKLGASNFDQVDDKLGGVTSITLLRPSSSGKSFSNSNSSSSPLTIHFLPPTGSSSIITTLTRQYASASLASQQSPEIDVKRVDADIRRRLQFHADPDIILIHQLRTPGFWSRILPRRAPELWGYPFWNLRITEIYQYSTPIPFPSPLRTLIQTLRSSSLPSLRKLGYSASIPPCLPSSEPQAHAHTGAMVLDRIEWEGALDAWGKVEQRLGR